MRRFTPLSVSLLLCLLASMAGAQVIHTTAALDTDNVFTGANTFTRSLTLTESACLSGAAGSVILCDDPTSHRLKFNSNTSGLVMAVGISSAGVAGNCTQLATNGIDVVDAGVTCGGGGGGGVNGSGTVGTIPLWTPSTTTLGNSLITQTIPGNASIQITKPDSNHLGNLSLAGGSISSTTIFTDTATCAGVCYALSMNPQYRSTTAASSGFSGIAMSAFYTPGNTSGTITTANVIGMQVNMLPGGPALTAGTSNITNVYGIFDSVASGNQQAVGTITNQYGLRVQTSADVVAGLDTTNNKGISVLTAQAQGGHFTNDYSVYIEPLTLIANSTHVTNHWGVYIADQGLGNPTNNTWYGLFIAPQSLGFGFNKPTPAMGIGGVNVYTGAGVPSLNCGTTPSLYLNNTAASVATLEYGCISGTTWTAISGGGGGAVSSVFTRTGAVVATTGDYTAAQITNAVSTAAANTGAAAMTLNMSASNSAAAFRLPNLAGATSTTLGAMSYDTTNKNIHAGSNAVDNFLGLLPSSISPANNDCVKWTVSSGTITLNTSGSSCGGIGGSGTINFIPVFTGTSAVTSSLLSDDGTTLSYSGTGGVSLPSSTAGYVGLGQGIAQSTAVSQIGLTAPVSVTGYNLVFPGAAGNGYQKWVNSSNIDTATFHTVVDLLGTNLDLTAQSGSLGAQTLVSSTPVAGRYQVNYYLDESAGCATPGPGAVITTIAWTDATAARTLASGSLAFTVSPGAGDTIRGSIPVWASSASAITATTTYTACSTGTATYDIHIWVTEAQ